MSHKKRKATTPPRRTAEGQGSAAAFPTVAKSALKALPFAAGVGLLLLFIVTALLLTVKDPAGYHVAAGMAVICLTALTGGGIAARFHRRRVPVLCGLAEGLLLLLLTLPAPLLIPAAFQHARSLPVTVGLHAALFPLAVAGALLASRPPKKHKRRH